VEGVAHQAAPQLTSRLHHPVAKTITSNMLHGVRCMKFNSQLLLQSAVLCSTRRVINTSTTTTISIIIIIIVMP
jgi:hypothetical protein